MKHVKSLWYQKWMGVEQKSLDPGGIHGCKSSEVIYTDVTIPELCYIILLISCIPVISPLDIHVIFNIIYSYAYDISLLYHMFKTWFPAIHFYW